MGILRVVEAANDYQKTKLFSSINQYFNHDLKGKTFAVWGLAFKPYTDDMREAPSRTLLEALWQAGAKVKAYDPEAMEEARRLYPGQTDLQLCKTWDEVLEGADGLEICAEWQHFRAPISKQFLRSLESPVIFDGRNLHEPQKLKQMGINYFGIGRGGSVTH
jgi:UDPglucose 6-dehydrogenase